MTDSIKVEKQASNTSSSQVKWVWLTLGVVLLVFGLWALSSEYWLATQPAVIESLIPSSCTLLSLCEAVYPSYFVATLIILLIACFFIAVAVRDAALRVTRDIDWTPPIRAVTVGRSQHRGFMIAAIVASVLIVVSQHGSEDGYPSPLFWFIALVLWGAAFYTLDRHQGHATPLRRTFVLGLVGYIALLILLGQVYRLPLFQTWEPRALLVALVTLFALVLWRSRRVSGVTAVWIIIATIGMTLYTYQLDSWRYAFIGDEYAGYLLAKSYITDPASAPNLLSAVGVYDVHPAFASYIHSASLRLFGDSVYGWRLSEGLMVMLSAAAVYALVRQLKGSGTGLLAAALFISSQHLLAFAHIGYNNLQGLVGFTAMLALAVYALQHRSTLAMFLCGTAAAFTFYTFSLTIPIIPLPLLLLALFVMLPRSRETFSVRLRAVLPLALIFVVAVVITASPRILNTAWLDQVLFNTIVDSPEAREVTNPLTERILPNVVYSLTANLYFANESHYITGPLADPITNILLLVGVTGMLVIMFQRSVIMWLLLGFIYAVVVNGALVPYAYPAHTRTYLLVPFYAVFAGLGAAYLWETLRDVGLRLSSPVRGAAFAVVVALALFLNLYQFFVISEQKLYKTFFSYIIREFQENPPNTSFYFVAPIPVDYNLQMVLEAHSINMDRWHPVLDPSEAGLREIRETAAEPYRVLVLMEGEGTQELADRTEAEWSDQTPQQDIDSLGLLRFIIIDMPASAG